MPATPKGIRGAVITGWGSALPPRVLTNDELSQTLDTSDEWIQQRTGIRERRYVPNDGSLANSDLATRAAEVPADGGHALLLTLPWAPPPTT